MDARWRYSVKPCRTFRLGKGGRKRVCAPVMCLSSTIMLFLILDTPVCKTLVLRRTTPGYSRLCEVDLSLMRPQTTMSPFLTQLQKSCLRLPPSDPVPQPDYLPLFADYSTMTHHHQSQIYSGRLHYKCLALEVHPVLPHQHQRHLLLPAIERHIKERLRLKVVERTSK